MELSLAIALDDIRVERTAQDAKWGVQNHPDGTGEHYRESAEESKAITQAKFNAGQGSWFDILFEEVMEAAAESDSTRLREELIQVGAVAVAWIEDIDRRKR